MTDCSSIHGSTSSSSDVLSSRGGGGVMSPRIRVIRLARPNSKRVLLGPESNATFGFAIRGGKEFGSGFFVSRVEKGSEADVKGLRLGDQLIRANGFQVDDAVHKELSQFLTNQDRLTLKVRGVGMLPVKEKPVDPLTWHIVPHHVLTSLAGLEDLPPAKEVRVVLKVAPRTKLGLGICKGPEWKPGIYVQFTKDFSVARDAGLRPGDQILSCNSIDFSDVLFSEAVAVMKGSHTLEMIVKQGAGLDLFPGESSGYNSSASSVTGDQSPCWGDQSAKRLSIVREENTPHYRLYGDRNNLDRRKQGHTETIQEESTKPNRDNNRTIIQLSGTGTLINNTMISNNNTSVHLPNGLDNVTIKQNTNNSNSSGMSSSGDGGNLKLNFASTVGDDGDEQSETQTKMNGKIADICFVSRQSETKTVIVEVHRSATEENKTLQQQQQQSCSTDGAAKISPPGDFEWTPVNGQHSNLNQRKVYPMNEANHARPQTGDGPNGTPTPPPPMPPPAFPNSQDPQERCPSVASSIISSTSLSSAISEELKKRQVRRCVSHDPNQRLENNNSDLTDAHDQSVQQPKRIGNPSLGGGTGNERRHHALMDEFKRAHRKMFKNGFQDGTMEANEERQEELNKAIVMRDEVDRAPNGHIKTEIQNQLFPTPPPPPQFANGYSEKPTNQTTPRRPMLSKQPSVDQPPQTPTPDYDSTPSNTLKKNHSFQKEPTYANGAFQGTLRRVAAASEMAKANGDAAELESLESFKLRNHSSPIPRPPSLYFAPLNSGPPTMKKTTRPVSVTIGEYGSCNGRKEPAKFDFISKPNENGLNGPHQSSSSNRDENVSEMLRSELEKTLSRSNLKKINENRNVNLNTNGATGAMVTNGMDKPVLQKTQSSNIERLASILQAKQNGGSESNSNGTGSISSSNRVTINFNNNKPALRKADSTPAATTTSNGILKNGFAKGSPNGFAEKNITFGN